ncbi:MAG: hypothetical protein PUP46_00495 [Endozoicomonas sp. (ex Botrylloides leachii)]|nr:hypothetical protein [Endozoicomonas sp. (ex Botrylloides leachii)]
MGISADKGITWYQNELDRGDPSRVSVETKEPDWDKEEIQIRLFIDSFSELEKNLEKNEVVANSMLQGLKQLMKREIALCAQDRGFLLLRAWWHTLLTPKFYAYIQKDQEWNQIIKNAIYHAPIECIPSVHLDSIHTFINKSELTLPYHKEYIEWILTICETNEETSKAFIGWLQQSIYKNPTHPLHQPLYHRLKRLIEKQPLPTLEPRDKKDNRLQLEGDIIALAEKIPSSAYLHAKISTKQTHRAYHSTPKNNSQLVPNKLVIGSPDCRDQTTETTSKPVIFDLSAIGNTFNLKIDNYINTPGTKTNTIYERIKQDYSDLSIEVFFAEAVSDAFALWVCQQKTGQGKWYWILDNDCSIQTDNTQLAVDNLYDHVYRHILGQEFPPEQIKKQLKEPSAIVLTEKDLLVMLDEFLKSCSSPRWLNNRRHDYFVKR